MNKIANEIIAKEIGQVYLDADLSKLTTYQVGGKANILVYPKNLEKLIELLKIIQRENIKYLILGNGSNVLFSDDTYEGIIIKLDNFNKIEFKDNKVLVGAGYNLIKLSHEALNRGLAGLEFASGIPGSVGGAIFMNAGAYNMDMSDIVESVKVLTPDLKVLTLTSSEMEFSYRNSILQTKRDYICLEVLLKLEYGKKEELQEIVKERSRKRKATQPLEYPSAGSVFRNPDSMYAGKIIEDLGLKGLQIGGAKISEKHANFIINTGTAKASDIKKIIDLVKEKVKENYNINLHVEQRLINWDKKNEK